MKPIIQEFCYPSNEYKQELMNGVVHVHNGFRNDLNFIYASATKIPTVNPKEFAGPVNKYMYSLLANTWFRRSGGIRTGVLIFDFITNWNHDLPSKVFRNNWNGNSSQNYHYITTFVQFVPNYTSITI